MNENPDMTKPSLSPGRRRFFIVIIFLFFAGVVLVLRSYNDELEVRLAKLRASRQTDLPITDPALHDGEAYPHAGKPGFVWDKDVTVRPCTNCDMDLYSRRLDDGSLERFKLHHVEHGIVRHVSLQSEPNRPVVLLVGDSHMHAVTRDRKNTYFLLERALREHPNLDQTTVVNASCAFYSPYQYYLRARTLWDELKPHVVIMVIFTGNDILDLEDVSRHHLDDDLSENPPNLTPPPQTTQQRRTLFHKTASQRYDDLFWQGMNQGMYFCLKPERLEPAMRKTKHTVALMQNLCASNGAGLFVVLLPSYGDYVNYDLPFTLDESVRSVFTLRTNRRIRIELKGIVESMGIPVIDAYDVFQSRPAADVYIDDFHISALSHALLADALLAPVEAMLYEYSPAPADQSAKHAAEE